VTTHRRAWMGRAGVVVALLAGALVAVPASPAAAAAPEVQIVSLSSGTLTSGQRATLTFRVANKNDKPPGSDTANIKVTSSFGELTCDGQCDFSDQIPRQGDKEFTATLVAGDVPPTETRSGKIEIRAEINGEDSQAERDVSVRGPQPQAPPTVKEISGRVTDINTGEGIAGAFVAIADSASHRYDTVTSETGRFRFVGSAERPITPGDIQIGAQKDDVRITKTISVGEGRSLLDYRLVLRMSAASPTASPSVAAAPSAAATLPAAVPTDSAAAAAPEPAATEQDSGGFGSLLFILIGGLLVALGVGAMVLLWLRRRDSTGEDDDAVLAGGPPVRPGYAGMGGGPPPLAGPRAAPTMAAGTATADAPTMLHRPVDEFPDPYGAPLPPPQPPTYPGTPGWAEGYGEAPPTQPGYGPVPPAGRPSSGGGYGGAPSSGGGYGSGSGGGGYGVPDQSDRHTQAPPGGWGRGGYEDRYDEPTGRFRGGDGSFGSAGREPGPYGAEPGPGGYGPDAEPGYGQRHSDPGYRGRDEYRGANGYDDRGGYDDGAAYHDRGGYNGRGGYDQRGGYGDDRGGYERGGYERVPEPRDAGYDNHGYDQGGYGDDSARGRRGGPPAGRSERRSVDWLDD
jgi:hypothetical protein